MIIYKCQNKISGKVYIGQTIKSLTNRIEQHIKVANRKSKSKFHKALISYGINNFDWIIIDTANTKDELNKLEIDYIQKYNCIDDGYNMVGGGTGGYNQMAVDANKKLRTGKTYEEIYSSKKIVDKLKYNLRKNIIKHNKIYGFNSIDKEKNIEIARKGAYKLVEMGYTHTNETKQKISDSQIGISYEDRHGKEEAQLLKSKISDATKKAMKKVDWDVLMGKALESRNKFWNSKHEEQKKKIIELKAQNIPIKTIIAQLNISTPTYYKLWNSIKNK
jgi:group I intron endonuclease